MTIPHFPSGGVGRFRHTHLNKIGGTVNRVAPLLPDMENLRDKKQEHRRDQVWVVKSSSPRPGKTNQWVYVLEEAFVDDEGDFPDIITAAEGREIHDVLNIMESENSATSYNNGNPIEHKGVTVLPVPLPDGTPVEIVRWQGYIWIDTPIPVPDWECEGGGNGDPSPPGDDPPGGDPPGGGFTPGGPQPPVVDPDDPALPPNWDQPPWTPPGEGVCTIGSVQIVTSFEHCQRLGGSWWGGNTTQ